MWKGFSSPRSTNKEFHDNLEVLKRYTENNIVTNLLKIGKIIIRGTKVVKQETFKGGRGGGNSECVRSIAKR